jgi:DNA-binding NarL/FixJ family response regulator
MRYKFLLIGYREQSPAFHNLSEALAALGEFQVVGEPEALDELQRAEYDMVILDAALLDNEMLMISEIRRRLPGMRIAVLTASPTWRRAREAIQAGAMDYISKILSGQEYKAIFTDLLARKLPPWP